MIWNKGVARLNVLRARYINVSPYRRVIEVTVPSIGILSISWYMISGIAGSSHNQRYVLPVQHMAFLVPVRVFVFMIVISLSLCLNSAR